MALKWLLRDHGTEMVRRALEEGKSDELQTLFQQLVKLNADKELVRMMLTSGKIDAAFDNNLALRTCCSDPENDLLDVLLEQKGVNPLRVGALSLACEHGNPKAVQLLLRDDRYSEQQYIGVTTIFEDAVANDRQIPGALVALVEKMPLAWATIDKRAFLHNVMPYAHVDDIKFLVETQAIDVNDAIFHACEEERPATLAYLLSLPNFVPDDRCKSQVREWEASIGDDDAIDEIRRILNADARFAIDNATIKQAVDEDDLDGAKNMIKILKRRRDRLDAKEPPVEKRRKIDD